MFSGSIISLPQIIVHIGGQNSWLVPIVLLPIMLMLIFLIFGKQQHAEGLRNLFVKKQNGWEKSLLIIFAFFVIMTFVHDLRALIDFVASVLLPNTPLDMLMLLSIFTIIYIAMGGLEVISRINAIQFVMLTIAVVLLPFLLANEWELGNFQPVLNIKTVKSILIAVFFSISWMGEMVLFLIVIANINPIKAARRAVISGAALGLSLFFLILFLEIAVLGTKIIKGATYPSYVLIQQIHLTDFIDRLDLVIASVWIPAFLSKLAFLLYGFNFCLSYFYKSNTNKFLFPLACCLGFLSVLLFKNNMEHLHFAFYTWNVLGIGLEALIILLFIFARRATRHLEKQT